MGTVTNGISLRPFRRLFRHSKRQNRPFQAKKPMWQTCRDPKEMPLATVPIIVRFGLDPNISKDKATALAMLQQGGDDGL
jgi:hypothetical protein